jgi:hypothetical protein
MSFPFPFKFEAKGESPEELPKPEDVIAAATAFPPKLSVLQSIPAFPEAMFEKMVFDMTGLTVPPGPNKMLASLMASFEAAIPAPTASKTSSESQPRVSSELSQPSSREVPTPQRRFELR